MSGDKVKVMVKFTATASMEVPLSWLDADDSDLQDPDEIKKAVRDWAIDNFGPGVYHSDYTSKSQVICVRSMPADLEVWDEMEYLVGDETEEVG